jgi:hypothetical protein
MLKINTSNFYLVILNEGGKRNAIVGRFSWFKKLYVPITFLCNCHLEKIVATVELVSKENPLLWYSLIILKSKGMNFSPVPNNMTPLLLSWT